MLISQSDNWGVKQRILKVHIFHSGHKGLHWFWKMCDVILCLGADWRFCRETRHWSRQMVSCSHEMDAFGTCFSNDCNLPADLPADFTSMICGRFCQKQLFHFSLVVHAEIFAFSISAQFPVVLVRSWVRQRTTSKQQGKNQRTIWPQYFERLCRKTFLNVSFTLIWVGKELQLLWVGKGAAGKLSPSSQSSEDIDQVVNFPWDTCPRLINGWTFLETHASTSLAGLYSLLQ